MDGKLRWRKDLGKMDQTNAHIAWVHSRRGSYLQTPIVAGDLL